MLVTGELWEGGGGLEGRVHRNNKWVNEEECGCGSRGVQEARADFLRFHVSGPWSASAGLGQTDQKFHVIGVKITRFSWIKRESVQCIPRQGGILGNMKPKLQSFGATLGISKGFSSSMSVFHLNFILSLAYSFSKDFRFLPAISDCG